MKRILLFAAVALVMSTADAQMKSKTQCIAEGINPSAVVQTGSKVSPIKTTSRRALGPVAQRPQLSPVKLSEVTTTREMKMRDPSTLQRRAPKGRSSDGQPSTFYRRPAGMYSSIMFYDKTSKDYLLSNVMFLLAKPYAEYYWSGTSSNANSSTSYGWTFNPVANFTDFLEGTDTCYIDYQSGAYSTLAADGMYTTPIFGAYDGRIDDSNVVPDIYQYCSYDFEKDSTGTWMPIMYPGMVGAFENSNEIGALWGDNYLETVPLWSSKSFMSGGYYGDYDDRFIFTEVSGALPYGDNERGWWFGKNGQHVDGMAQAFEKPQHPYLLNKVYVLVDNLTLSGDVEMTCKVYKLNDIPAYEDEPVVLPEEPGDLVAHGRALVTPDLITSPYFEEAVLAFTLYDETGAEFQPVIDYPILVVLDGYNDADMEDLIDFSAYCSYIWDYDEGYGELAYLKYEHVLLDEQGNAVLDENGNNIYTGEYEWSGANSYFSVEVKLGLSIFIDVSQPYVTFENVQEDGQYLFPATGGYLQKTWLDGTSTWGLRFKTSCPSAGGDWRITCDGSETLPSWLSVSLMDVTNSTGFNGVRANVSASALPSGMTYREAVVRFEIPGDYIEYKFMQGTQPMGYRGDVNLDGTVSISDVTQLIDILLSGATSGPTADVNADGGVNISDVTQLIDMLLGGIEPAQIVAGNREFTVNGVTFKMMAVEGCTFAMGATRSQNGSDYNTMEKPVHMVTLSDYYIGQTEVTQALWQAVMGSNPSNFTGDLKRPVEMVSWNDCQQFITKLNQMTGMNFHMPTEAQWEFAARGGIKSRGTRYSGSNVLDNVAWYNENANGTTHPVGTKAPNELGIYDMSGNIYEYCQDRIDHSYGYPSEPQVNPTGQETGDSRIIRGGSIDYGDDNCRVARRWGDATYARWKDQGLRLAL